MSPVRKLAASNHLEGLSVPDQHESVNAATGAPARDPAPSSPWTRLAAALLATAAVSLGVAASASAELVHPLVSSFTGGETASGFIFPVGLAADNSGGPNDGDLYGTDLFGQVVDQFDQSGKFLKGISGTPEGAFAGVVGQSAVDAGGNVYIGDTGAVTVDEFSPTGEFIAPQIKLPEGPLNAIAVNSSGEVLIATPHVVFRYDPATHHISTFATGTTEGPLGNVEGIAVDDDNASPSFGHVYVVDRAANAIDVFEASGKYLTRLVGTPSAMTRDAVDPGTGDVYVTGESAVYEFSPTGEAMSTIPSEGRPPLSVAVNAKTGDVYVGVPFAVDVYGPGVIIPDVSPNATTSIEPTSATVHGHLDPAGGGEITTCQFEYGTTESGEYAQNAPCEPGAPYTAPVDVSSALSGLTADTAYHFRLSAGNANGTNRSHEGTFETSGEPSISGTAATGATRMSVSLEGEVDPHGIKTSWHFEYGPTEGYGTTVPVPDGDAGSGFERVPVNVELTGLTIGATYHYRLVASNSQGVVTGPDETFSSEPVAGIKELYALAGPHSATIKINAEDFATPTGCELEYVTAAAYAAGGYTEPTIVPCGPEQLPGVQGPTPALAHVSGLASGTTYHYRFLLSNTYGEQLGPDRTFATFGLAAFSLERDDAEGHPYNTAGGHPYVFRTHVALNTNISSNGLKGPAGTVRDIRVHLPAGLIGNPQAAPRCSRYDSEIQACHGDSQIGMITVEIGGSESEQLGSVPLFNVVPPHGVAAELGARFSKVASAFIQAGVRTGSDYGIDADSLNISTQEPVTGVTVEIWGVPADPRHEASRFCPEGANGYKRGCPASSPPRPFFTLPADCEGPFAASVEADAYQAPGEYAQLTAELPAVTGCETVPFNPTITLAPESHAADSPTGLHVDVHLPQNESPTGLAEADLKDATVTLPEGFTVNPASAGGLTGCSPAQIELHGPEPAKCPDASKVGTVELTSPLVDHPLKGAVYVAEQGNGGAAQGANPFGSLIALYIGIDDPETGVVVKLAGKVALDAVTGRVTTTFDENPQLPFEDLKLDFFGGPRAALATPPTCGSYTAGASFASWAEPGSPITPFLAPFTISSGPGGGPCPAGAFAPAFTAGAETAGAGAFAPYTLHFSRRDGEQNLKGLETTLPAGELAKLAGVPQCASTDAAAGSCPDSSRIGAVTVTAGAGTTPITVHGQVFLTGAYNGGAFGEVVEVPAIAGPFNLDENGKPVTVRGSIRINPTTAQATVVSDPFPTIQQGVPLKVRSVTVTLDRPGFSFNPTSCDQKQTTGLITGAQGASVSVSSAFQVSNCALLAFKPVFKASTAGHASRANGASFDVKVTSHGGPQQGGGEANIAKVKVTLPKALPTRDSTLKKACPAATFEHNPTGCPAAATVGTATVHTPLLAGALSGPAILVSHAGLAFPDLDIVLQGEGVTLTLVGNTDITRGITTSTFNSVPDAPISSFELKLPAGQYSILGAYAPGTDHNLLCGKKLNMPTTITAQNGAVLTQTTRIATTGCGKVMTVARRLRMALKACAHSRDHARRAACARLARRTYRSAAAHGG